MVAKILKLSLLGGCGGRLKGDSVDLLEGLAVLEGIYLAKKNPRSSSTVSKGKKILHGKLRPVLEEFKENREAFSRLSLTLIRRNANDCADWVVFQPNLRREHEVIIG